MANLIDAKLVSSFLPKRNENSNKGSFGKVLNIAGSKMFSGAAFLSSISALKVGAGFVTLASTDIVIDRIASSIPELVYSSLNANDEGTISSDNSISNLYDFDVISLGTSKQVELIK